MKKQYIIPSVTVDRFDVQDLIATSTLTGGGSNRNGGPNQGEAPRRRSGIWDEE